MSAAACLGIRLYSGWKARKLRAETTLQLKTEIASLQSYADEKRSPDRHKQHELASADYRQHGGH